jgi:transketolase
MARLSQQVQIGEPTLPAQGIAKALRAAAERDPRVLAILEDMGFPDIEWWTTNFPERMVEVGISEQNGAVVAAALASEGFIPVINSFLFANVGRAYNQVRQSILVDRFNVKFIGREGAWGEVGISHNTIENMAACRPLPNLVILNPADVVEAEKATEAMMQYVGPVVLRQESSPTPPRIFTDDYPFDIGKGYFLAEGRDATIVATGYMLSEALVALDLLESEGLDVGLLNMGTIKPLDEDAVVKAAQQSGALVTAENGTVVGGLGEAVAAVLCEKCPAPLVRVGVEDEFSQSGLITPEKDELKEHFALRAQDVAAAVMACVEKKERLQAGR